MLCERAHDMLGAFLDGELAPADRAAVASHVSSCRACSDILADYERLGRALVAEGRQAVPAGLAGKIDRALDAVEVEDLGTARASFTIVRAAARGEVFDWRGFARRAAVVLLVCGLSASAAWWASNRASDVDRVERDIISAHVRSLLQDSPVQVASSDQHTVRPWFAGRVDVAPAAKELAPEGFPLVGGRLDYIDGRRVSVVVYKRRLHTINVFQWPSADVADSAPKAVGRNGYNMLTFTKSGITTWMVSDLNGEEIRQLAGLL